MYERNKLIAKVLKQKTTRLYFNSKDSAVIKEWDNKLSKRVWEEIEQHIFFANRYGGILIYRKICPFCIAHSSNCSACEYQENHGCCGMDGSDWAKLYMKLDLRKVFSAENIYSAYLKAEGND